MTRERIELTGEGECRTSAAARDDISARALRLENGLENGFDSDDELRFLRTERRVPVRRGPLARKTASRIKIAVALSVAATVIGGVGIAACGYGIHSRRFFIASSDNIDISGVHNASRVQVMEVAGADIGRNLFFVPLDERRAQLEKLPWVESATVMRLFPDRIAVDITERTPVAFVQIGNRVNLIDARGVVLGPPASRHARFSFPVIRGITETESLSTRAAIMKIYNRLVRELGSDNTRQLSEVDLSDPEDVKATINDAGGTVLVHLGASDFLERYKLYSAHIGGWRQQFQKVQSVDLRYEGQIIVNPDTERSGDRAAGKSPESPGSPSSRVIGRTDHRNIRKAKAKSQKLRAKS